MVVLESAKNMVNWELHLINLAIWHKNANLSEILAESFFQEGPLRIINIRSSLEKIWKNGQYLPLFLGSKSHLRKRDFDQ